MSNCRPSVCIDSFIDATNGEMEIPVAVQLAADAGIGAFEFWSWWDKDLDTVIAARDANHMQIATCCTKFISLVDPSQRDVYLAGLEESIAAAAKLNVPTLISQVGDYLPTMTREDQHASLVDGLKATVPLLEAAGITLVIEPLNELVDHAGYYLVRSDEAFQIIDEVGSSHVKVIFDIYHQQISEGHLIHNITSNIDKIAHFHAAGNPGRNELTTGEINYPSVIQAIRETNYDGYFGLEYWPINDPLTGLKEAASWF